MGKEDYYREVYFNYNEDRHFDEVDGASGM